MVAHGNSDRHSGCATCRADRPRRGAPPVLSAAREGPLAQIPVDEADRDPRPWLAEIAAAGFIPQDAVAYLQAWLEQLAPLALNPPSLSFCHGDMNVSNVLVDPQSRAYLALIEWTGVV